MMKRSPFGEIGLAAEYVDRRSGTTRGPRTASPISPAFDHRARRPGSALCQRKFSCTISGTPALSQAVTIARASAIDGANGFWQMTATPRRAAISTSGRCDGDRGRDIDEVEFLLRQHLLGVGIARGDAELIADDREPRADRDRRSRRSTAPSTSRQPCRWLIEKNPQPISAAAKFAHVQPNRAICRSATRCCRRRCA